MKKNIKNLWIVVTYIIHTISHKGNHQNDFLFSSEMTCPLLNKFQENSSLPTLLCTDAGYMSDACQYQQPWGQPLRDPEILSQMSTLQRPNPRVVKIPNFEATSSNPPDDGTPPPVYQDGPASLNDAEWRGRVWMTYCGDVSPSFLADGTPPPVYQDGPASLNDAEWHGQVWMTYCGDASNVKVEFVKLEAKILRITEAGIANERKRKFLGGSSGMPFGKYWKLILCNLRHSGGKFE